MFYSHIFKESNLTARKVQELDIPVTNIGFTTYFLEKNLRRHVTTEFSNKSKIPTHPSGNWHRGWLPGRCTEQSFLVSSRGISRPTRTEKAVYQGTSFRATAEEATSDRSKSCVSKFPRIKPIIVM